MRPALQSFMADGPLPAESVEEVAVVQRRQDQLMAIEMPISPAEAHALAGCFGSDGCFGMAWTLLHLIESAAPSHLPFDSKPGPEANEWHLLLWERQDSGAGGVE
jgi:hypothetical protein